MCLLGRSEGTSNGWVGRENTESRGLHRTPGGAGMTKEVQLSVVSRRGSQGLWELAGETSFSASGEEVSSLRGCPRRSRLLLGQ